MKKILAKFKKDYIISWGRNTEETTKTIRKIAGIAQHYAYHFNTTPGEMLRMMEEHRDYSWPNYYNHKYSRIDKLDNIFETEQDAKDFFKDKIFICPACNKESLDPYECTSNNCDWKSYGLFGCLGKGYKFIIKDTFFKNPTRYTIFKPQVRK